SSYDRLGGVLLVDSGVEEKNAGLAQEEILRQIDAICRGDFTTEEFESAKRSAINQYQTVSDLQSTLANWYIGQSLDSEIATPEEAAKDIAEVSPERVIEAARSIKLGAVYMLAGEGDKK
ncbi:MAG TPA: insulinase family protein, partial [Candidatus Avimonas sp.]|nr:insulinase family protein [Candidatus Avimonas sp.]